MEDVLGLYVAIAILKFRVIFGFSQCQVCSNMWLITLVMLVVLGALLVCTTNTISTATVKSALA